MTAGLFRTADYGTLTYHGGALEVAEGLGPEGVEVVAHGGDPVRVEGVDPPRALRAVAHEPRLLEHLEVLGDGGAGDGQLSRQLADRPRPHRDPLEDLPPRGVGQGRQCNVS